MQPNLLAASKRINEALQESKKLFSQLSIQSRFASANSSSVLFGMLGGFVGAGIAYAAAINTTASFVLLAPILCGIGLISGILAFRGKARIELERQLERHARAVEAVREQLKLLPKNAPQAVKDELWESYRRLLSVSPISADQVTFSSQRPPPHFLPQSD